MGCTIKRIVVSCVNLLVIVSAGYAINWSTELVDANFSVNGMTMIFTKDGWPCVAYASGGTVKFAERGPSGWTIENVASNYGGGLISLDLDSLGYPHISYCYHAAFLDPAYIYYAFKDNTGWHIMMIDEVAYWGGSDHWSRIKIDRNNYPHIVYLENEGYLDYAYKNVSGWHFASLTRTVLDTDGWAGFDLDLDNHPHIVHFYDYSGSRRLEYVYYDGFKWNFETIESNFQPATGSDLALDANENPHVVYNAEGIEDLKYAYRDANGWHITTVDNVNNTGDYPSIALDYADNPRVSYHYATNSDLRYGYKDASGWHFETVASAGNVGQYSSIQFNTAGEPFIAYSDQSNADLWLARPQYYPPRPFSLLAPTNGAWANPLPMFRWQACSYQGDSISRYELWIDGIWNKNVTPPTITASQPASPMTSGWHTWRICAIKTNGNSIWSNETWSVRIDATPPTSFDLQSPSNNIWTIQRRPIFSWTPSADAESGLRKYQIFIDGFKAGDNIPPTSTSAICPVSLPDGSHTWFIRALDNVGNYTNSNQTWTIKVDSTGPNSFSLVSPLNNIWTGNPTPTFIWRSTIDNGIGLSHYQLWMQFNYGTWVVKQDSIVDTTYTLLPSQALTHGTWCWRIRAIDSLGNYRETSYRTLYVDLQPPLPFSLSSPLNNSIAHLPTPTFYWHPTSDPNAGLAKYQLWIDSVLNVDNIIPPDTSSAPSSPLAEGPHRWFVNAVDNVGNVRKSTQTWTIYLDWNPPDTFSLSTPADYETLSINLPTLVWHPSHDIGSGIKKYQLWINSAVNVDSIPNTDTISTPSSPLANGFYTWYVKAFDYAGGERSSNQVWRFVIIRDSIPPTTPQLITPANGIYLSDSSITFIWRKSSDQWSGIRDYRLQYAKDSLFFLPATITVIDTFYSVNLADTTYYWRVRAYDNANNPSEWSTVWKFTIDTHNPAVPTLISPIGGIFVSDTLVTFEWTVVTCLDTLDEHNQKKNIGRNKVNPELLSSPVRYILQIDTVTDFISPLIVDTLDVTSITIPLYENFPFYWRVRAYDLAGNQGPYSNPDSFGVDITAPVIDSTTVWNDTSCIGPFEILTKVTDNLAGVDSVLLYYKRDEDPAWVSRIMRPTGTPDWYLDTIPAVANPNDTVRYYIRATDLSQPYNIATDPQGAPTNYYWFIANYTGIAEMKVTPKFFSFGLKGNPIKDKVVFNLSLPKDAEITLRVHDVLGRLIDIPIAGKKSVGVYTIPWTKKVSSGVYFYSLETPWEKKVGKFVLLR